MATHRSYTGVKFAKLRVEYYVKRYRGKLIAVIEDGCAFSDTGMQAGGDFTLYNSIEKKIPNGLFGSAHFYRQAGKPLLKLLPQEAYPCLSFFSTANLHEAKHFNALHDKVSSLINEQRYVYVRNYRNGTMYGNPIYYTFYLVRYKRKICVYPTHALVAVAYFPTHEEVFELKSIFSAKWHQRTRVEYGHYYQESSFDEDDRDASPQSYARTSP